MSRYCRRLLFLILVLGSVAPSVLAANDAEAADPGVLIAHSIVGGERADYVAAVRDSHTSRRVIYDTVGGKSARRWKRAWVSSLIAVAAANALDMASSTGKRELNPLLRDSTGGFSTRRAGFFKGAIGGGFALLQWRVLRKHSDKHRYKSFAIANYAAAGAYGAVAARNFQVER